MMRAISTATTGMQAQESKLDQIANDMANMNTNAYKKGRTEFHDLMYQTIKEPGRGPAGLDTPVGVQVGSGSRVAAQYFVFEQGPTQVTNGLFDVAISGDGFFAVQRPDGQIAYTRDGNFTLDGQGRLVNKSGFPVVPPIQVPQGTTGVVIAPNGEVKVTDSKNQEQVVGQISLVSFINPSALKSIGGNLLEPSSAAGPAVQGTPGENGMGGLQQGALEASNVNPTESVMSMIKAQRVFEGNAKIGTTADQMWQSINNIAK